MKTAAKIFLISLTIIGLFNLLLLDKIVFAANTSQSAAQQLCQGSDCPIQSINDIYNILAKIVQYTYEIFFIVAVLFILFAAFTFLTAQGDPQKIISAKKQIFWASVAIAIALLSVGAEAIIKDILSSGQSIPQVPTTPGYILPPPAQI